MSADNWAYCPKCRVDAIKAKERLVDKASAAYGKKPAEEYLALRRDAEAPLRLERTLREDYGLGVGMDGVFRVSYRSGCIKCNFSFEFTETKPAADIPGKVHRGR